MTAIEEVDALITSVKTNYNDLSDMERRQILNMLKKLKKTIQQEK